MEMEIPNSVEKTNEADISRQISYCAFDLNDLAVFAAVVHWRRFLRSINKRVNVVLIALNISNASYGRKRTESAQRVSGSWLVLRICLSDSRPMLCLPC